MQRTPLRRLAVLAVFVLLAAACGGDASEVFQYSELPTSIVIMTDTGDVIVDADAAVEGVEVVSDVSNTEITSDLTDGVLTITDDCDGDGCSVNYFVQLRADVSVTVTTVSGTISVSDVSGDATLLSSTGLITLNGVAGSVVAATEDAMIIATRMESALAEFSVGTGDIDVTFDEPIEELRASTGSGDVTAQLPDGAYVIDASTGSGEVELVLESDPSSDKIVTLATGDGDITVYRK